MFLTFLKLSLHTYFCPVTGRGLESHDCRALGSRSLSPYSDVEVQVTGWPLMVAAVGLAAVGIFVDSWFGFVFDGLSFTFAAIAFSRFTRQYLALRQREIAGR